MRSKKASELTHPESRMMKTTDGFHYAYNAEAVVDEVQVVLAAEVTTRPPMSVRSSP